MNVGMLRIVEINCGRYLFGVADRLKPRTL